MDGQARHYARNLINSELNHLSYNSMCTRSYYTCMNNYFFTSPYESIQFDLNCQ